ncbi:serine protein kinase RIO [Pseudonocardia sp. GCM10023141]|uniref:serine protein kinase RIO n=1 Tax=Pseudonocardia sp. GCM10023141 TaxID=3252653 RepID=UPI003609B685
MRENDLYDTHFSTRRGGRRRFDDDEPVQQHRGRTAHVDVSDVDGRGADDLDGPPEGDRWSTWDGAEHGPQPRPDWVITDHGAVDAELGVIKTGKEADVHLVERSVPGTGRRTLLAAKRYRSAEHRMFHRDAGYLEGRRVRRSREMRAMANRTAFGRDILAGQWAGAEFAALTTLWSDGVAVPYPVQVAGTELLIEFLGSEDGSAAPRLAQLRPEPDELVDLWEQLAEALLGLARHQLTHGDLSAYNLLVHDGRLMMIDLPQVVDVIGNPQGPEFLARDVRRIGDWFVARGLPPESGDPGDLLEALRVEAGMPGGTATSQQ